MMTGCLKMICGIDFQINSVILLYFIYPDSLIVGKLVALFIYCKSSTALATTGAVMTGTLNMIILYAGRKWCHNIYPSHYWLEGTST